MSSKPKTQVKYIKPKLTDTQRAMEDLLTKNAISYGGKYIPGQTYPGLSGMTSLAPMEKTGMNLVNQYLTAPSFGTEMRKKYINQPTVSEGLIKNFISTSPEILTQAKGQVSKLLQSNYNPYESDFYKGTIKELENKRKQTISRIKNLMAAQGQRQTGYASGRQIEAEKNVFDKMSNVISNLGEQERVRKLNTVMNLLPYMSGIASQERGMGQQNINAARMLDLIPLEKIQQQMNIEKLPLEKAGTALQYGSLPRILQQIGYQDFLRRQQELANALGTASTVYQTAPSMTPYVSQKPSAFQKVTQGVAALAPLALAPLTGGSSLSMYAAPGYSDIISGRPFEGAGKMLSSQSSLLRKWFTPDKAGAYNVGYGQGYYPGGYKGMAH